MIFKPVFTKTQGVGGGGGTLVFSSYVDLGPASTIYAQKYREYQAPPKNVKLLQPQKYPH